MPVQECLHIAGPLSAGIESNTRASMVLGSLPAGIKNNPHDGMGCFLYDDLFVFFYQSLRQSFYAILLTVCAKRDTFLEAVFLWNTPFEVALSIVAVAASNADFAASLSLAATAAFTFLTAVLTPDLIALFLSAFVLFTKILFFADLMLAKMHTSCYDRFLWRVSH